MRFFPKSLFGRLALILFSGLLLTQLISTAIQLHDRGQRLFHASGLSSSERIAEIVRLLDDANIVERKRLISILNTVPLRVSLSIPDWPKAIDKEESKPSIEFRQRLQKTLGKNYSIQVAVSDQLLPDSPQGMHGSTSHTMQHMQNMGMTLPDTLIFFALVELTDGTWVAFENSISKEVFADSSTLLIILVILISVVLFISLLAVRWVTRPLTMLTQAADKLGSNINQPPLLENGPIEVSHAAKAFNSMQIRLQKFIEDRSRLLSAISHDLKTPITRMRLRAEMLDDPEQRDSFIKNLDEMQQIASETLNFLRADDARESLQQVNLCALLEAIQDDAAELSQHVVIETCSLTPCLARPQALKRCIRNLVENAIKYGDSAIITTHENEDAFTILINDSGPGIAEENLQRVFEPFYRLETSRSRETGGSGLGLSIARNIALSHGGNIQLLNHPDGGLQAILTLSK